MPYDFFFFYPDPALRIPGFPFIFLVALSLHLFKSDLRMSQVSFSHCIAHRQAAMM